MGLACFKAYDIRGRVPSELDEDLARAIGRAYVELFQARRVVVGRDMRLSSPAIAGALADGLREAGADVVDIGLGGTELVYFAAFHLQKDGVDGGIAVTASHNPADYNGMKLVQKGAVPISGDSGLREIEALAEQGRRMPKGQPRGKLEQHDVWPAYVEHLLRYVDAKALLPLKVVANAGNGCAGLVIDKLEPHLPLSFVKVMGKPDGRFPNGVPNPILVENHAATADVVRREHAALGLAWDGDHDRCFFFDEQGAFVEGYYMVGLFAQELLRKEPGAAVIHDPRLVWNTIDLVNGAGGRPVLCKTGHAFIKERMRKEDAVYGGEMSAHHYFRDFAYCDSGMIPWLLLAQTMSRTKQSLGQLVADMQRRYPASGEINLKLTDAKVALAKVRAAFAAGANSVDETDGVSIEHAQWRVNVRASNTEPVVRVNVETRGDQALMRERTEAVLAVLRA
ncbi:MAG: phosphomannomutase [Deltaproteobacteria bacterium RBG_16_71_12]|nr:MAG: phosphomannomutase [Deltaproteobacteria bacterium RBG_16_71_12]